MALFASLLIISAAMSGGVGAAAKVRFTALSMGGGHVCAVTSAGGVMCLGNDRNGELGDGTHRGRLLGWAPPVAVKHLPVRVTAVAAGASHTCALTVSGGVYCWGKNFSGQLGDGTTKNSNRPVAVVGLGARVKAIIAGNFHTCALTTAGGVKCWGGNQSGQLGIGNEINQSKPVNVIGLSSGVVALSAAAGGSGEELTCALTTAGGVKCFGSPRERETAWDYPGFESGVTAMTAGISGPCAVVHGAVKCGSTPGAVLVDIGGLHGTVKALDGWCALMTSGAVECWGDARTFWDGTARDVPGLASGVQAVASGWFPNGCALMVSGSLRCWDRTHPRAVDVFAAVGHH